MNPSRRCRTPTEGSWDDRESRLLELSVLPDFDLFGEAVRPPPPPKVSLAPVYHAYERAGGRLDKWGRAALGQQARKLVKDGFPLEKITRAAEQIARAGTIPAYLGKTLREMPTMCVNGEARARLSQAQLGRCPCASCAQWHQLRGARPLSL